MAKIREQLTDDEYQVVEFGRLGLEIGPVSSGHFPVGKDPEQALMDAVNYAVTCGAAFPETGCTYEVRRVQVSAVTW